MKDLLPPASSASGSVAAAHPAGSGSFRLVHYCVLVGLAFVLSLVIVWQQVSTLRLGYRVQETRRQCEQLGSSCDALRTEIDSRVNHLALATMVRDLQLPLDSSWARSPARPK